MGELMGFYGLNLPSDILDEEKFKGMSAKDKKSYVRTILKKILELNPNGVTISQIHNALPYISKANIWHHLETMVATREAYSLEFGKTTVYYPNGRMVHPLSEEDIKVGDKFYAFFLVRNNFGDFIYIQEKKKDKLGLSEICGGLIVPLKNCEDFIEILIEIKKQGDKIVRKSKG